MVYFFSSRPIIKAVLQENIYNDDGRRLYARVKVEKSNISSEIIATPLKNQSSGVLTSMFLSNGLAICPSGTDILKKGQEIDVEMFGWEGKWIEILGAGMVHPKVLNGVGYDPEKYSGFAFGLGVERMAMLKYDIPDDHPARDQWDTIWLDLKNPNDKYLLRTHTSPMQARIMEENIPPIRVVVPGKCYRYEHHICYLIYQ